MASWLLYVFENLPRINFSFRPVNNTFMFFGDNDYVESLIFWATTPLILCLLLFSIVVLVWSCQCCRRRAESEADTNERPAKRRSDVEKFACGFYTPIVFLCIVAGVCLFANEWANRGMNNFVSSLDDLKHSGNSFLDGLSAVNGTLASVNRSYKQMNEKIIELVPESRNETALKQLFVYLDDLNKTLGRVVGNLGDMGLKSAGFRSTLSSLPESIARIELERWVLVVILYSMLFVMGIFGLIAVCKRSRKGVIGYGVGGMFVFVIGWALAAAALFISLMIADACTDVKPYIESKLPGNASKGMFDFYVKCIENSKEIENPIMVDVRGIETQAKAVEKLCQDISVSVTIIFSPAPAEVQRLVAEIQSSYGSLVQGVSGLIQIIDCRHIRREFQSASSALCFTALPGFALALLFTLIFCLTLFGVLIGVSKAWKLFKKRFNDYVEVENQDPFTVHRGASHHSGSVLMSHDQSNIPADFYGTHVFNPRTRFASAAFTDEPEVNGNSSAIGAAATAPTWRNTPPPAYDSMHRAQQMHLQNQRRQQQTTVTRTLA